MLTLTGKDTASYYYDYQLEAQGFPMLTIHGQGESGNQNVLEKLGWPPRFAEIGRDE